jgi:hypothetical protein
MPLHESRSFTENYFTCSRLCLCGKRSQKMIINDRDDKCKFLFQFKLNFCRMKIKEMKIWRAREKQRKFSFKFIVSSTSKISQQIALHIAQCYTLRTKFPHGNHTSFQNSIFYYYLFTSTKNVKRINFVFTRKSHNQTNICSLLIFSQSTTISNVLHFYFHKHYCITKFCYFLKTNIFYIKCSDACNFSIFLSLFTSSSSSSRSYCYSKTDTDLNHIMMIDLFCAHIVFFVE